MLTRKQRELLVFINDRLAETGVAPSFDEMKDALDLRSKSGIHRLITALEERGFLRRLPNRARALEVLRLPDETASEKRPAERTADNVFHAGFNQRRTSGTGRGRPAASLTSMSEGDLPVLGRIAAGTPIAAIQHVVDRIPAPALLQRSGEHFILEVQGDSMVDAGIQDGDYVVIQRADDAVNGEIVVALVDREEATLKRVRKKGASIALEAANPAYETRIYGADRVEIQGRLVGLMRRY